MSLAGCLSAGPETPVPLHCALHVAYHQQVPVLLQIRSVPDALHRTLKARAAEQGIALSDYALAILKREASRPTRKDMLRRFAVLSAVKTRESTVAIVRKGRQRR